VRGPPPLFHTQFFLPIGLFLTFPFRSDLRQARHEEAQFGGRLSISSLVAAPRSEI